MSILLELEKAIGQFKEGEPVNEQLRAIQNDTNFYEFFSFSEEVNLRDDFELIAREEQIFFDDDIIREYFESPDKDIDSDEDVKIANKEEATIKSKYSIEYLKKMMQGML